MIGIYRLNSAGFRTIWLLSIFFLASHCQKNEHKPNFLLIIADDYGWTDLSSFGSSFYETPNLDALAASGIKFTNGYASCPVCSPTRASIQTGKYPVRSGITDWIPGRVKFRGTTEKDRWMNLPTANELKVEEVTIADALKQHGYKTFFAGKWHLGETEEYWPEHQGYDINKGGYRRGAPNKSKQTNGYFSPYGNPRLEDGPVGEYLPERLAGEAVSFIQSQKENQPFFACLSFYLVHTPLQAKQEDIDRFAQKRSQSNIDTLNEIDVSPEWSQWATLSRYQERHIQGLPVYAGMVHSLDENIGRVIQALKTKGLYDNTVIIFTSDNGGLSTAEGWPTSNKPLRAGKGWLYEGGIRVPWIMSVPDSPHKGIEENMPVSSIDILPTILSLAGADRSELVGIDGVDLSAHIGDQAKPERPLYWHYPHYSNQGGNPGSAVRMGKYKLIHDFERGSKELYDLESDLGETTDVSAQHPDIVDSLYLMLDQWRSEHNAVMMTEPNPDWDTSEPVIQ